MTPVQRASLILSAFVGGVVCVMADLLQKSEASAVLLIGRTLEELFFGVQWANVIAIVLVLTLAIAVSLIFESDTKRASFYLGASVLAILMTITPYKLPPGFQTAPNSVEVNLSVSTEDSKPVKGVLVTLRDAAGKKIVSRTRLPASQLQFFQDGGTYRLVVELDGYHTHTQRLSLKEGSPPETVEVTLKPSSTPLVIQRILR
jgi:hypothetical protein